MRYLYCYGPLGAFAILLSFMLLTDIRARKVTLSQNSTRIRLFALSAFFVLSMLELIAGMQYFGHKSAALNVALADAVLMMCPPSYDRKNSSYTFAAVLVATAVVIDAALLFLPNSVELKLPLFLSMIIFSLLLYKTSCFVQRMKHPRIFLKSKSIEYGMEESAGSLYAMIMLGAACLLSFGNVLGEICGCLMFAFVFWASYTLSSSARVVILSDRQCAKIEKAMNSIKPHPASEQEDNRMNQLYHMIIRYMTEDKPFLSEEFSLDELSSKVFSNRVYVSKTINVMSGKNFRQFINSYRVEYSQRMMQENPRMKMSDVASRCGFHTIVSYNQSFRFFTGQTPGEWLRNAQAEALFLKKSA